MCINTESAFPKINIPVRERASTPVCPSVSLTYCTIAPLPSPHSHSSPDRWFIAIFWREIYIYIRVCAGKMNWQPTLYGRKFATLSNHPAALHPCPPTTRPSTSVHQTYSSPNLSVNHQRKLVEETILLSKNLEEEEKKISKGKGTLYFFPRQLR